jgi:hypothetical protein
MDPICASLYSLGIGRDKGSLELDSGVSVLSLNSAECPVNLISIVQIISFQGKYNIYKKLLSLLSNRIVNLSTGKSPSLEQYPV